MHPFLATLPLSAVILFAGCAKHPAAAPSHSTATLPAAKVRLANVRAENVAVVTEITGTIRPEQRAQLAAKVMGAIEELPVTLGQRVRAGDLLAKISAAEISARVVQAQSQLNAARRDLERERGLLPQGASTADMVRGLEDRFAAAQAMVREAEVMLGYTQVRAPFDGVIARKPANVGDLASPGQVLLDIEGTAEFHVEVGMPDSLAQDHPVGARFLVEVPATGSSFTGTLAELSPAADGNARTVLAKIAVPAGTAVRSGQFARVQVPGAPARMLLAPLAALSPVGQLERVFVANEQNRVVLRLVKSGAARNDRIEILSGLEDGERIVVAPPAGLREGQLVEALP